MARFQDLNLAPEPVGPPMKTSELPAQYIPRQPLLQPGFYRFRLPEDLSSVCRIGPVIIVYRDEAGAEQTRQADRVTADLTQTPLIITTSPRGARTGESFPWSVTNIERWRNRAHTRKGSDLDDLLVGLGETVRPGLGNNQGYIDAFMRYAGRSFGAQVDIAWVCSGAREIYMRDGFSRTVKASGVYGNGKRYTTRQIQKDADGTYSETIEVPVEAPDPQSGQRVTYTAIVRGFNNLSGFRA